MTTHVWATMPAARAFLGITGSDLNGDAGDDIAASFRAFPIGVQGARGAQQEKAQFLAEGHEKLMPVAVGVKGDFGIQAGANLFFLTQGFQSGIDSVPQLTKPLPTYIQCFTISR